MIKIYKLAKTLDYGMRQAFGPLLTLSQAERYQADMEKAGFNVVIINTKEGEDSTLSRKANKCWTRFSLNPS